MYIFQNAVNRKYLRKLFTPPGGVVLFALVFEDERMEDGENRE
jgi:hypothetical protein